MGQQNVCVVWASSDEVRTSWYALGQENDVPRTVVVSELS